MDPQLFADFTRNPMFTPDKIDEVLTYFHRQPNVYELAQDIPLTPINAYTVEMEYAVARTGGMTPMVSSNSESPIVDVQFSRGSGTFEAIEFREKVVLDERDLANMRKLGSKSELKTAQEIFTEKTQHIQRRLADRLEWMRHQLIFDQQVSVTHASGPDYTVAYEHPPFMEATLTGSDLWSDYANSDPTVNLQEWVEGYLDDSGMMIREVRLPRFSWKHLQRNDAFRGALLYNRPAANTSLSQLQDEMRTFVGLDSAVQLTTSQGRIHLDTQLTAAAAAAATTLNLENAYGIVAGDKIVVSAADTSGQYQEKFEVASVSGNAVTVTAGVARATGFAAGDAIRVTKYTQPLDKLLIIGRGVEGPADMGGIESGFSPAPQPWAVMATTLSHYPNLYSPQTGVFTRSIPYLDGDPPRVEQVIGVRALPKLNNSLGWFVAKIL